jgi:hypothetical protein
MYIYKYKFDSRIHIMLFDLYLNYETHLRNKNNNQSYMFYLIFVLFFKVVEFYFSLKWKNKFLLLLLLF